LKDKKEIIEGLTTKTAANTNLWRGGLSDRRTAPLVCEAALNPVIAVCQIQRMQWFYDCCAAERGDAAVRQAPSPQDIHQVQDLR
jgi:hypothetical protein